MEVDLMDDTLGPKGRIKKSEFIRVIIDALNSLGFDEIGSRLEEESNIPMHSSIVKQFLEFVKNGEWDKSINALQGFELSDEKDLKVKLLLLEQKFHEFLKIEALMDALSTLRDEIVPLGISLERTKELAYELILPFDEDTESVNSRSKVLREIQKWFPPAVIIPERRLEYIVEDFLDHQMYFCTYHNTLDSDLSLCTGHNCGKRKIPSETVQVLEKHTDEVWFLKFSHSGNYLASSSKDKSAIIWEINEEGKFLMKHKLVGHEKPVVVVLWSPDDQQVITCGESGVIRRWDVGSGQCVQTYERNGVSSVSCGWFHDGSGIIGAMENRHIYMWNLDGTEIEHEQDQLAHNLSDVAMTTDGKWLVSVGKEQHEISFFNRETNKVEKVIGNDGIIASFSLSSDNTYILFDISTEEIQLWKIDERPHKFNGFHGNKPSQDIIRSCFGGYKESFVASGSDDSKVYIWHTVEWTEPCRVLSGHTKAVNCVSWNPTDLHMLASASDDGTIRIWGIDKKLNDSMETEI